MYFERLTTELSNTQSPLGLSEVVYLTTLPGRLDLLEPILQSGNTESWEGRGFIMGKAVSDSVVPTHNVLHHLGKSFISMNSHGSYWVLQLPALTQTRHHFCADLLPRLRCKNKERVLNPPRQLGWP